MPGLLKPDAKCPVCSEDIILAMHTWKTSEGVCVVEFVHRERDKPDCERVYDWDDAMKRMERGEI